MAESVAEQIRASFKTELESIAGDDGATYWYTPGKVVRTDFPDARNHFRTEYDSIYMVIDTGDQNEADVPAEFGEIAEDVDVFVYMTAQDKRGERDPFKANLLSGTIRNRMVQDVVKKLEGNYTRGGLSYDTRKGLVQTDFANAPEGWIVAGIHFVVTYSHALGEI